MSSISDDVLTMCEKLLPSEAFVTQLVDIIAKKQEAIWDRKNKICEDKVAALKNHLKDAINDIGKIFDLRFYDAFLAPTCQIQSRIMKRHTQIRSERQRC